MAAPDAGDGVVRQVDGVHGIDRAIPVIIGDGDLAEQQAERELPGVVLAVFRQRDVGRGIAPHGAPQCEFMVLAKFGETGVEMRQSAKDDRRGLIRLKHVSGAGQALAPGGGHYGHFRYMRWPCRGLVLSRACRAVGRECLCRASETP